MVEGPTAPAADVGMSPQQGRKPSVVVGARFLTVAEVAAIMRVSKMTVYRLVHSGELVGDPRRAFFSGARGRSQPLFESYFGQGQEPSRPLTL